MPLPFFVLGNPDCRRVDRFQSALAGLGFAPATVLPWTDFLAGRIALPEVVTPGSVVRIEAPGTLFATERALLAWGADCLEEKGAERLSREEAENLAFDRGRIVCPHQWYLGFQRALQEVARQRAACPPHRAMNAPAEIAVKFDKPRCQEALRAAGLPVPRALGLPASYDDLIARMRETHCRRVFVKLAHGSSASGVVAFRTKGTRQQAITTVEMVRQEGRLLLYNSRRIRRYETTAEIADLIDALCRHRVYAEEWIPKAGMEGHAFDLRIVGIAGRARHAVARLSRTPMTNLHLLNQRRSWEAVQAYIGPTASEAALQTCERAFRCFPQSHYLGLDLLFTPGFRRHAVLEINAFGDLLPGTLYAGHDTYTEEILAL